MNHSFISMFYRRAEVAPLHGPARVSSRLSLVLLFLCAGWISQAALAADNFERAGDWVQVALPMTAWGLSYTRDDDEGFMQFSKSFFTTMLATQVLKQGVNETRPDGGHRSFPSGHTSASFSGASFLQRRYGSTYGLPAYIAATFVGWSRIESNRHYPHDVLAGAALAMGINHYFVTRQQGDLLVGLALDPANRAVGLNVTGRWKSDESDRGRAVLPWSEA